MRLDADCIRDILFTVEEYTDGISFFELTETNFKNFHLLLKYDFKTVFYHVKQLVNGGYLEELCTHEPKRLTIKDLTWNGHQFIENIRTDTVWNKVKQIGKNIGSLSVSVLSQAAAQLLTQLADSAVLSLINGK